MVKIKKNKTISIAIAVLIGLESTLYTSSPEVTLFMIKTLVKLSTMAMANSMRYSFVKNMNKLVFPAPITLRMAIIFLWVFKEKETKLYNPIMDIIHKGTKAKQDFLNYIYSSESPVYDCFTSPGK